MSSTNPEIRAAEIVALINGEYITGGWFAAMTPGEQAGWNINETEWWAGERSMHAHDAAPKSRRELAGWLACEIHRADTPMGERDTLIEALAATVEDLDLRTLIGMAEDAIREECAHLTTDELRARVAELV